ncbi:MAG: DUF456 domain-containing protein [Candidatus Andersenbacteria bacterium]
MVSAVVWSVIALLFAGGLAGTIIPGVPGVGLVFLGIFIYAITTEFTILTIPAVVIFAIVALLAWLTDYLGSAVGSKLGGGSKKALLGTVVGAFIGALAGPLGIFVGAFTGGLIGALLEGKSYQQATRVALFSVLGTIGSTAIQLLLAIAMIGAFFIIVF